MSDLFLIQDPYHPYAKRFIEELTRVHGLRPVFFFTNPKERYYMARGAQSLARQRPAASYEVDAKDLRGFADRVRRELGGIAAIVPYAEHTLAAATELLQYLEIPWNGPEVLMRFRDKVRLKADLARARPSLRLGSYAVVERAIDLPSTLPHATILKPVDGFGSRGVHVLAEGTPRSRVDAILAATPGVRYIAEEYLRGTLYAVDGYVDADGAVTLVCVFTSERISRNGSDVVYGDGALVHRDEVEFGWLERYATEVIQASGLTRSPFHMEVMLDARGACLIDVGARLIGHDHAWTCMLPYGGAFDFFAVAAHGYVSSRPRGDLGLDVAAYAASDLRKVYGVSEERGLIARLEGVSEIEQMEEFRGWRVKPTLGARLAPTVDLFTVPYSFVLGGERGAPLAASAQRARERLRWNRGTSAPWRMLVQGVDVARRARRKAGWLGTKLARVRRFGQGPS